MPQKSKLTARAVTSLVTRTRSEQGRVEALTTALSERGFRAVVEETFELSDYQRSRLDAVLTPEFETVCRNACLVALRTGGTIRYRARRVKDGETPPALRADVECEGDLDELHCGVTFEC